MEIIQRLVRDGSIDLAEALILLEGETVVTPPPPFVPQEPYYPSNPDPYCPVAPWVPNPIINPIWYTTTTKQDVS